jgi:hypothetical protein
MIIIGLSQSLACDRYTDFLFTIFFLGVTDIPNASQRPE